MSSENTNINMNLTEILERRKAILKILRSKRKEITKIMELKQSKPEFLRHMWWKFSKFQNKLKWKKPRGKDNPMRLSLKGAPPIVRSGYGTPEKYRSLHPSSFKIALVANINDLEKLNPKEHIIYISSNVGLKKRLELISIAKSRGFK
ncbi:MAG: 50S ribosomal protein L32e, partial [Ignisphaera sp.]